MAHSLSLWDDAALCFISYFTARLRSILQPWQGSEQEGQAGAMYLKGISTKCVVLLRQGGKVSKPNS